MPEFILDTSFGVLMPLHGGGSSQMRWSDLDAFTQGYIEALFFTENDPGTDMVAQRRAIRLNGAPDEMMEGSIPNGAGFSDLAPEALATILADCAKFKLACVHIEPLMGADGFPDEAQAGRDFWCTRNGHGCGFRDGDWLEPYASELTNASMVFREVEPYLGDDGKIYL